MASWYDRTILPRLISCACAAKPIMKQRAKVVPHAEGRVLELGIGGGLNLGFYDHLTGIEPLPPARRWGPPAHDQRSKYRCVDRLAAPDGLGLVAEYRRLTGRSGPGQDVLPR